MRECAVTCSENPPIILVVEDSKSILQELQRRIPEELGFTVEAAADFAGAERLVQDNPERFYCAVLDLNLPDAPDGEIVDLALNTGIPAVVFTSGMDEQLRRTVLDKGVADYIFKDSRAVCNLVRSLGRLWANRDCKVLVCEDSRSMREHVSTVLRRRMFQVLTAADGKEALEVLEREPGVRVVVTDFAMSGMDGLSLVRKVRETRSNEQVALIGISSNDTGPLSVWFLKAGADDFLRKPFLTEEIICRVEQNLERLERVEKLKDVNESRLRFLGFVAHDLRNPINGIRGFANLLKGELTDIDGEQQQVLDIIAQSADNMLLLVDDLLGVSAIQSGKLELRPAVTDLRSVVRDRVTANKLMAKRKSIGIDQDLEELPLVSVDAARIGQVLDNLLSNAIKFSMPGTTISVRLARSEEDILLSVCDQGPGIDPEEQGRLFQDYHKGKAAPTGGESSTGLGLFIVQSVIKAHGGSIDVASEKGAGACFHVRLPFTPVEE